jgi:hypothetical protein
VHIKFRQPLAYFVVSNSYRDATCLEIVLTPDQPFVSSFQNICHALLWDQYIMRSLSFIFTIWTEQSGSSDNDSHFCLGVTWLSNNKHPNYIDWGFKLIYLVPPDQYWNSTSNWAKIIPFTFIPVHPLLPFVWLTFTVHMIAYNNRFNPPLVSVQQLTIFRETKCITKLLTYIIKWSSYPWKLYWYLYFLDVHLIYSSMYIVMFAYALLIVLKFLSLELKF